MNACAIITEQHIRVVIRLNYQLLFSNLYSQACEDTDVMLMQVLPLCVMKNASDSLRANLSLLQLKILISLTHGSQFHGRARLGTVLTHLLMIIHVRWRDG